MAARRQPAQQPFLIGDNRQVSTAWIAFFDSLTSRLAQLEALAGSTSYANDAAAAAGGVQIGALYRNGSAVMVRVS